MRDLTKRGPLVRRLNKELTHIRWMGCKVAVYDLVVPRESGVKERKFPRAHRGTKRRGKRAGNRNSRKRRRLVTADPTFHSTLISTARSYRANYRESRLVSYVGRTIWSIVKLHKVANKISDSGDVRKRIMLRQRNNRLIADLVDLASRASGSPILMARIRIYRAVLSAGGPMKKIRWGNYWVEPDDAYETYKDFIASRQPSAERNTMAPSRSRGTLTYPMLDWLVTSSRWVAPYSLHEAANNRSQVANAPCVYCSQAPCARPGVNAKGVPLCKRLGVLTRPWNAGGKRK